MAKVLAVRTIYRGDPQPRKKKRRRKITPLPPGPAVGPLEDNVPLPRARNNGGLRERMKDMKPGQSFVTAMSANACRLMGNKLGFAIRYRPETESTIRVWRHKEDE